MDRYLSEWLHIRRHGTSWNNSTLRCNGKLPNSSHYRPCPFSKATNNSHLSLSSFASCPNSLSNNRQTRMIASIDELGCYSKLSEWTRPTWDAFLTSQQIDLLASAVDNLLRSFVTFGLIEHIVYTQYMYRVHFGLIFRKPFSKPLNATHVSLASAITDFLPKNYKDIVRPRNRLDELFFQIAQHIFAHRLSMLLQTDTFVPKFLRIHLRHAEPKRLLTDHDLESKISRHLLHIHKLESRKYLFKSKT